VPVSDGRMQLSRYRLLIKESRSGNTKFVFSGFAPAWFASDRGQGDNTVQEADVGSLHTLYFLHKSRVGLIARLTVCFVNTGSPNCDQDRWIPFVWMKLINSVDNVQTRLDLQRAHTSFPTFQFYFPERRSEGIRDFPLVRRSLNYIPQAPDPNTFINNPEDSNEN
jgi:hypothetical protein